MSNIPRLRRGFRFQWEPAQQSHVLLYPEGMVRLNGSAGAILAEVNGARSRAEIIESLERQFPEAGSLAGDVDEFLTEATRQHWIEWP
ncbi:pyrroloquinoline quinone biosynthesis peptide chaperone PqqD [Marinobacter daepoensis]|uniref:PqqA binding protein n=1 Tax=Marinobacter daepoensis TaxID=262077 RepID=A0ABS3BJQ3_9GAMM|nr:pyrroloquinoline quinone biosynthesis peptide chaperone PqqD [Marinobacter daepoensis]MBN7770450.1 pyrroloquinoline quinone biosynthesis peptide chaperone PqqD [Marinobacter daepoensis]MBY6033982.1 pyrroloquinoline quinone biosynthesis peptide chaperone PqqD [Marinobacter daepoensis]MBY6079896.1 pyrroloquinoline quinone biosynthesis peptide chaperone PqqD [Marinobacter daepoensis]